MLTYAAVLRINNLASMLAQLAKEVDASYLTSLLLPPLVLRAPQDKKCLADLRAIVVQVPLHVCVCVCVCVCV